MLDSVLLLLTFMNKTLKGYINYHIKSHILFQNQNAKSSANTFDVNMYQIQYWDKKKNQWIPIMEPFKNRIDAEKAIKKSHRKGIEYRLKVS